MKHLYMLLIVCLYCTITTNAQTKYWIGPATGGTWNNAANWSDTQGGAAGADVPNAGTYNVFITQDAEILVDMPSFSLNSLTVGNNATARLYEAAAAGTTTALTLLSTVPATPALQIDAGSTLEDSSSVPSNVFVTQFGNDAQGLVEGTWTLLGVNGGVAQALIPAGGTTTLVTVTGTLKLGNGSLVTSTVPAHLSFGDGSQYWIARTGGNVPNATWHANATILITGMTNGAPTWNTTGAGLTVGHVVIDCPNLGTSLTAPLPNNLNIQGNLQVISTKNLNVVLGTTSGGGTVNYTVQGNVSIGPDANVTLGGTNMGFTYAMQVNGNFEQTGGTFNLRNAGTATVPTILRIKGNINQTAGTFGCPNTATSTTTDLFVVELNGTTGQSLTFASPYIIDNANNQVVLAMNNSAGATLQTPLSVGKVSWEAAGKGNITTGSNVLTIRNTSLTDTRVVNGASDAGFVNGAVARITASNTDYIKFPTGKAGKLREAEIKPADVTATTYSVEYKNTGFGGTVQAPLTAVSSAEHWDIGRIAGTSDATVRLTLGGTAVPGASATDTLVVAHYTGGTWTDVRDTKLTPGNSTTGSVESALVSSFSPFTFGFTSTTSLPIYLVNFTARKEGSSTARLSWTITENSTPQKFEVLRSTNGSNFTTIGTVAGAQGKLTYDFTDAALPTGTVYYRLRMIDIDGSGELTKIVAVMNGVKGVVISSMMPTLVTNRARLNISSSEKVGIQLVVTDIYGRRVKQQVHTLTNGNQELWLELATLPAGSYQVTGYLATGGQTSTIRFIKQ